MWQLLMGRHVKLTSRSSKVSPRDSRRRSLVNIEFGARMTCPMSNFHRQCWVVNCSGLLHIQLSGIDIKSRPFNGIARILYDFFLQILYGFSKVRHEKKPKQTKRNWSKRKRKKMKWREHAKRKIVAFSTQTFSSGKWPSNAQTPDFISGTVHAHISNISQDIINCYSHIFRTSTVSCN